MTKDPNKKTFIDPIITTSVIVLIIVEIFKGTISFFTKQFWSVWWGKRKPNKENSRQIPGGIRL